MADQYRELTFNDADFGEMKRAEQQLVTFLIKLSETTHPLLLCYTLIRCARVFLRKSDREAQRTLVPVLNAYLRGDVKPPKAQSFLWTPDSPGMN